MKILDKEIPQEIIDTFYEIYDNKPENLKKVPPVLLKMGMEYMDILVLTRTALNLKLRDAIILLEIPEVIV